MSAAAVEMQSVVVSADASDRIASTQIKIAGGPLQASDYVLLESSWISRESADASMLRRVDSLDGKDLIGHTGRKNCAGIAIPYFWPGCTHTVTYRLRRDQPDWKTGKDGSLQPHAKYLSSPGGGNRLYIPVHASLDNLGDAGLSVVLVEGEKKAIACWRLANYESKTLRFLPIAIPGVWSWRGTVGKTGAPDGSRVSVKGPIPDLARIEWTNRIVYIVFDSNIHTNDNVKWARRGIARELASRGAKVKFVTLPADCGVNGIDDLLGVWGPERVLELFEKPDPGPALNVVMTSQYRATAEGLVRETQRGDHSLNRTPLTNYTATITKNLVVDDGVEQRREFEIEAKLPGQSFRFTTPAAQFASMDWPILQMGVAAITYPNQKEYARTAIQSLSLSAEAQSVYAHTGWRDLNGTWAYLHAGGAIGANGPLRNIDVRLPGPLLRYKLECPKRAEDLVQAVRASLRLTLLGPVIVCFPVLAGVSRAVFGASDFAIHLAGETGTFKSELAALAQQHYGKEMDRLHLPDSWASTANALEALAFHSKDALLVIDDFAPQGGVAEVSRYHASAERLFRSAGNHSGRGRLDSSATLRQVKPPRALVLSTGEEVPRGHSVRARLLIVEIAKGSIDARKLAECQRDAREGLYAVAFGGFVHWLAGRYEEARAGLSQRATDHREKGWANLAHARTPEMIGQLQAAFEIYLEFAVSIHAIDDRERTRLQNLCWKALSEVAAMQVKHHEFTEPTAMFITLLRSAIASGRAHLADRNGGTPARSPGACGWRSEGDGRWLSKGDRIGWIDEAKEAVYLDSTAAYRIAQLSCRDAGESLSVTEATLKRRMRERDLLASTDTSRQTITIRRKLDGATREVLHLSRETVLPGAEEDPDGSEIVDQ